jgi:predicted amidohydrolase YtcJ
MMQRIAVIVVLLAIVMAPVAGVAEEADLVLVGGSIVTLDASAPIVEAIACRDDCIVAMGTREKVSAWIGQDTQVLELNGDTAFPGFIEGHAHFVGLGISRQILDLTQAKCWDDIVAQVQAAAALKPAGQWIRGRGWHQAKWSTRPKPEIEGCPTHTALSQAVPDHPVSLTHASGHMCVVNAKTMEVCAVDANTPAPSGGEILRDRAGQPTGVFRETAMGLIRADNDRGQSAAEQLDEAISLATEECLRKGITSFHDAGASLSVIDRFRSLAADGQLKIRLWVMMSAGNAQLAKQLPKYRTIGFGNNFLTVRGIKRFIDGALGSHGAWMLEPYADLPTSSGLQVASLEDLRDTAHLAVQHDMQLCIHAIGDRANRETLDLYEEVFAAFPSEHPRRWRIEHAQHLHPADVARFARIGVTAAMQGSHCTSDAVYAVDRLGEKRAREGAYAWRVLLDSGALIINGTDAPVEDVDPLKSFYASVTRRLPDGSTFFPSQRMTREEALRSYTINAAKAVFEADLKGTLSIGKLADIVVLSNNLLTCPEKDILTTQVRQTIIGGRVVYRGSNTQAYCE